METTETLGKYEIKRPLGRGAMGTVYEGWDPLIARRVAIKTVKLPDDAAEPETKEALARFRREAQAAGRLHHPNIVGVFDYGETSDLAFIVMEFVDGPPLKSLLDKHERFTLTDTVRIMDGLLAGLQFSHERGVVHRDIKPANVMLTSTGQVKIADFGIARIESSSMTQAGTVLGTPAYMSPEQFMGQVVDARTDIYSSGVLLYQLLTGERPFEGGMSAIMHKALHTEPPAPSQLSVTAPPAFDAVVRRAMAKRPEDRFASASTFAAVIRAAMAEPVALAVEAEATMVATPSPAPSRTATVREPIPPVSPPARRSSMPAMIAAGVVGLAVVSGGAWWLLQRPPAASAPATTNMAANTPVIGTATSPTPTADTTLASPTPASDTPAPIPTLQPTSTEATAPATEPQQHTASPPAPTKESQSAAAATTAKPTPPPVTPPPVVAPAPPPQPPVLAVQPGDQQFAMANLASLRSQIAQWVNSRNCAVLGGDVRDGGSVVLSGLAGNGSVDGLRQDIASLVSPNQIDWRVSVVDPVFCPALNALHPLVPAFAAAQSSRLGLQMAEGKTRLHDGDPVRVWLVMPDFASRLLVDYIAHDGSVQHLYPQLADPKIGIAADPPRAYSVGESVDLHNPAWTIGEPYGTDMIIAVASSTPLFDHPRPSNAEQADVYVRDLQAAIDKARQHGARLAGAAVTLDALPKQ